MSPHHRWSGAAAIRSGSRRSGRIRDGGACAAAQVPADHVASPHDPLDPLAVDPHALVVHLDGHPRGAGGGVNPADLLGEGVLDGGASLPGRLTRGPAVEPGAGHRQDPTQPLDAEGGAVGGDEPEAAGYRSISFAK
jgi:hypothetical protein